MYLCSKYMLASPVHISVPGRFPAHGSCFSLEKYYTVCLFINSLRLIGFQKHFQKCPIDALYCHLCCVVVANDLGCQLLLLAEMFFYQSAHYRYQLAPFLLHIRRPGIFAYFVIMYCLYQEQFTIVQAHLKNALMLQVLSYRFAFVVARAQLHTKRDFLNTHFRHKPLFKLFTQYLNNRASLVLTVINTNSLNIINTFTRFNHRGTMRTRLIIILLFLSAVVTAQPVTVEGLITDGKTGDPLIGAVVRIGESGATTGADGRFSFQADMGADCKLVISYVGYRAVDIPCNPGQLFYNIALENDFVGLNDVQVKAQRLDVDALLNEVVRRIPQNYESAHIPLSGMYKLILHNTADTQLIAQQPIFLYNYGGALNGSYYFNYSSYRTKGSSIQVDQGSINQRLADNYVYNVLGRLTGRWDKYLKRFVKEKDEHDVVISTFNILGEKYYNIVLVSKSSKSLDNAALRGRHLENDVFNKQYIWLREFRIHAEAMVVTYYQEIMLESDRKAYKTLTELNDRNKIDDWLNKAMKEDARYTSYKLIFHQKDAKWRLRKEIFRDSYWNPFNTRGNDPPCVYYFEYDMGDPLSTLPREYEKFNPDLELKKHIATH